MGNIHVNSQFWFCFFLITVSGVSVNAVFIIRPTMVWGWIQHAEKPSEMADITYMIAKFMVHFSICVKHSKEFFRNQDFLIKLQVFIGFSAKLEILKGFEEIKGFKDSPKGPAGWIFCCKLTWIQRGCLCTKQVFPRHSSFRNVSLFFIYQENELSKCIFY